jgi:hypothetical protein
VLDPHVDVTHASERVLVAGDVRVATGSTLFGRLGDARRTGLITPIEQDVVTSRPSRADSFELLRWTNATGTQSLSTSDTCQGHSVTIGVTAGYLQSGVPLQWVGCRTSSHWGQIYCLGGFLLDLKNCRL